MDLEDIQTENEIKKENLALKEEISVLKKMIEKLNLKIENQSQHSNVSHMSKNNNLTPPNGDSSSDSGDTFVKQLKKKNKNRSRYTNKNLPHTASMDSQAPGSNSMTMETDIEDNRITKVEDIKKQVAKKRDKPPPILYQDSKDTVNLFARESKINNFHIKRLNISKHIAQLETLEDFNRAKELLSKANTNFYSFTSKVDKRPVFLLKGLNHTYTENEVLNELQAQGIEELKFNKVSKFATKKSILNNTILPIFLVQLSADSNLSKLKEIKYLNYHVVYYHVVKKVVY